MNVNANEARNAANGATAPVSVADLTKDRRSLRVAFGILEDIEENNGELIETILAEATAEANAAADVSAQNDKRKDVRGKLYSDVMKLADVVARATAGKAENAVAFIMDTLLEPILKAEKLATAKAYVSTAKNAVIKVYHPRLKAGERIDDVSADVLAMDYAGIRKAINPPKDPNADNIAKAIGEAVRFIQRQANDFGGDFILRDSRGNVDDTLETNAAKRLADIYNAILPHYNAVKSAADAEKAKSEAAKAGATMAGDRNQNEREGSVTETVTRPEAKRATH